MATIEESVMIKCPVNRIFVYTTEARNWPKWQSIIREAEQTSPGPWGVGTTTRGVTHMMGLSMKWTAKVTENEPDKKWAKHIISGGMNIDEHGTYNTLEGVTKFTIAYDIKIGGLMKLFSPMIISTMRKETVKSLNNLKSILEAQA
jgi:uncharacterized membrane protein